MNKFTCSKCAKRGQPRNGNDRYCTPCRRAYNAQRNTSAMKKKRADSYYWNVTVPKMRARGEARTHVPAGKMGVYNLVNPATVDAGEFGGMIFHRTSDTMADE